MLGEFGTHRVLRTVSTAVTTYRSISFILIYPLVLLVLPLMLPSQPSKGAYILLLMSGFWVTEVIPIYVTALIPVLLGPAMGIIPSSKICPAYMKDTNMLFVGGLFIACALEHHQLHKRIAITALKIVGSDPKILMLGFMVPTWFLSMWMCNTATTAMMITIVEAVLNSLETIEAEMRKQVQYRSNQTKRSSNPALFYNDKCEMRFEALHSVPKQYEPMQENGKDCKMLPSSVVTTESEMNEMRKLSVGLSLCVCYASSCGGVGTITGTAPNSIFFGEINSLYGGDTGLTFGSWMALACPISIVMLLFAWLWLTILYVGPRSLCVASRNVERAQMLDKIIETEARKLGPFTYAEGLCCALFALVSSLWITRNMGEIGWGKYFKQKDVVFVSDAQPAIMVSLLAFILPAVSPMEMWKQHQRKETRHKDVQVDKQPLLPWEVAKQRFPWGVVFVLGGGFALSDICRASGLSTVIGEWLSEKLVGIPSTGLIFLCCILSGFLTEFTSNAATVSMLLPIVFSLASKLNLHPFTLAIPSTIATSFAFSLPAATPPNSIVFGKGRVKVNEMIRAGVVLNFGGSLISLLAVSTLARPLFGLDSIPTWAINRTTILH
ncbi:unnamed protein product [Dicrocoelium dendriticum]|nr:unnamed protein product [Dicrocoelium dendriticum]